MLIFCTGLVKYMYAVLFTMLTFYEQGLLSMLICLICLHFCTGLVKYADLFNMRTFLHRAC